MRRKREGEEGSCGRKTGVRDDRGGASTGGTLPSVTTLVTQSQKMMKVRERNQKGPDMVTKRKTRRETRRRM